MQAADLGHNVDTAQWLGYFVKPCFQHYICDLASQGFIWSRCIGRPTCRLRGIENAAPAAASAGNSSMCRPQSLQACHPAECVVCRDAELLQCMLPHGGCCDFRRQVLPSSVPDHQGEVPTGCLQAGGYTRTGPWPAAQNAACSLCKVATDSNSCLQGAEEDEVCRDGADH